MKHLLLPARIIGLAAVSILVADPALAGVSVPGPVLGAGAPALAVIAGAYWLIRKRRSR